MNPVVSGPLLAVETSCDETAVAILSPDGRLLASEISSQIPDHRPFGGVVPELASRNHIRLLRPVCERALAAAGMSAASVGATAATQGPGLSGALLAGFNFAKGLATALRLPFVAVNHMEGHLLSPFMGAQVTRALGLVVSGGHTLLVGIDGVSNYRLHGRTRDDAAGEAFDKVARLLGLPYPGGPEIERAAAGGDPTRFAFPRALPNDDDFSFSGLKNAARLAIDKIGTADLADFCASFQEAVVDSLVSKSIAVALREGFPTIALSGGVACNARLREKLAAATGKAGLELLIADRSVSADNAAMIGHAALLRLQDHGPNPQDFDADVQPALALGIFEPLSASGT